MLGLGIDCVQNLTIIVAKAVPEIWLVLTNISVVYVTWPRPFQDWFVIHGLALAMINLPTRFELSISTYYEDMKGDTKYQKWSGLG